MLCAKNTACCGSPLHVGPACVWCAHSDTWMEIHTPHARPAKTRRERGSCSTWHETSKTSLTLSACALLIEGVVEIVPIRQSLQTRYASGPRTSSPCPPPHWRLRECDHMERSAQAALRGVRMRCPSPPPLWHSALSVLATRIRWHASLGAHGITCTTPAN